MKRLAICSILGVVVAATMVLTVAHSGAATDSPLPVTPYSGFNPSLTRAPYVTDLTQTSAYVNWATSSATPGSVQFALAPGGSCPSSVTSWSASAIAAPTSLPGPVNPTAAAGGMTTATFTVGSTTEHQWSVPLTGLSAGSEYCYAVFSSDTSGATDLLPASQHDQTFTTLDATGSTSSLKFAVLDDLGESYYSGGAPSGTEFTNDLNTDQAALDKQLDTSGARFAVLAGDTAYNSGTQTNYGDLAQTGTQVSDMFGPSYWPETNGIPTFHTQGDHGLNGPEDLQIYPTPDTASSSAGTYAYDTYPASSVGNTTAINNPDSWYAIQSGNVRIYVLTAAWHEQGDLTNTTGQACSPTGTTPVTECEPFEVDYDDHWTPTSAEYQWLKSDLAAHPGGVKMAVFHFPLRSDNSSQPSDVYLQNSSANPNASTSLEALLSANGVQIAFNGHAHTYQRINPRQAGQITNYVTGGGGGVLEPVNEGSSCTSLLASAAVYALGWSPSGSDGVSGSGSSCNAPTPQSAADVYNFLLVTVAGNTVTVSPTNAAGQTFDVQSYTYGSSGSSTPSTPSGVTALATSSTSIGVNWTASTENPPGIITSYTVSRKKSGGSYTPIATVPATSTAYSDSSVQPGTQFTYEVTATDNTSHTSTPGTSNTVATPSMPGNVRATAVSGTSVQLTWTSSSETGGSIQSYQVDRNGATINTVPPSTSYTDTTAQPGTTYTYSVTAIDGIGAPSTPANANQVTTPGQAPVAPTGGCMSHLPAGSVVGSAALPSGAGYYEVDSAGDVAAFGAATCYGAMTGTPLNKPVVGMAVDPATGGYWLVATDGGIFSFNAPFYGSTGNIVLNKPIVGMAPTPSGGGYWMVASDGGVFTFGNNQFYGSTGNLVLNKPVVGMAVDPATGGYWLVATDGGIFSFNAPFFGSTGAIRLNQPVVGMAATADGSGYRLVASDGGVFCFNLPFFGSTGNIRLNRPMVAGLNDNATGGYWLTASDGGVFSFNAPFLGSAA